MFQKKTFSQTLIFEFLEAPEREYKIEPILSLHSIQWDALLWMAKSAKRGKRPAMY